MKIEIGDIVNVKDLVDGGHWKGKVTDIHNNGREITVQDKGINFAEINVEDLKFIDGEYWER